MRPSFSESLRTLLADLDPAAHADAVTALKRCRAVRDLEALAADAGGWLNPSGAQPRLRLVQHGSGTFLLLAYEDGWGTTLSQADFWRR